MSLLRGDFPKQNIPAERSAIAKIATVLIGSLVGFLALGLLIAPTIALLYFLYCNATWFP
jgi:hypothetical protein